MAISLLAASMGFREGHWREDCEDFREELTSHVFSQEKQDKGFAKRANKKIDDAVFAYKRKQEDFNRLAYKSIETVTSRVSEDNVLKLENHIAGVSLLIEEFYKSKNSKEFLMVVKMYNQGFFDQIFKEFNEANKNEQENVEPVATSPEENV